MLIREQNFYIVQRSVTRLTPQNAQEFYVEHKGKHLFIYESCFAVYILQGSFIISVWWSLCA